MATRTSAKNRFGRAWGVAVAALLTLSVLGPAPAQAAPAETPTVVVDSAAGESRAGAAGSAAKSGAEAATAAEPPDPSKFQRVVLGQGTGLGEVMELTVADDGRVFFITRAGDISMYDPASGGIEIIMNNPELGVWSGLEDGGLGITVDPAFAQNGYIYVYYAPLPESYNANRLARLTVRENAQGEVFVDKTSEKVILEVGTQRNVCCHSAGSVQFGADGVIHLATGDNTSSSDNDGFSPHDERPGRSDYDSQKSSGNTNDLRGKIIRVTPRADDAGDVDPTPGDQISYDIPAGNLFGEGGQYPGALYPAADPARTRPEIYVMGVRNPYRLGVDADTDVLYWGEVGPDSRVNNPNRGPRHFEEYNRTDVAMNGGWPYCGGEVGDDLTNMDFGGAYVDWDFVANRYRTNPDGTPKRFPCNDPAGMTGVNDSPNSTGLVDLPPMTDAWLPYSDVAPFKYPEVEGATPSGGQVYRQSQNTAAKDTAFPAYYEGSYFISEMSRGWIKEVRMDDQGNIVAIDDFMSGFAAPGDLEFGPDGSMYVLEYGTGFFSGSPETKLVRIDYAANGRAPVAKASADKTEGGIPLTAAFSSAGSNDPDGGAVTYAWDFENDGTVDSTEAAVSHTYEAAGDYSAVLTVTDSTGKTATSQVVINAGNTRPKVAIELPADGGFFDSGDDLEFSISVSDAEEQVDCANVVVQEGIGHDIHVHPGLIVSGCQGTMPTAESADHGPDANTYGVLLASYADKGANAGANEPLTGNDSIILQPKHRQAEHATERNGVGYTGYDDKSGTRPGGGGLITGMGNGNWVMFAPMSLVNMTKASVTYSGGGGSAGAAIELRAGAPDGPVVSRVALDGGTQGQYFYKTVTGDITARDADVGGRPLYLVYSGTGEVNFDEMRFVGKGVASNTSPTITSATATPADGPSPLAVAFAAEATDPDGDAVTYGWDFGVEGSDTDVSTEQNPSYTYAAPGRYTATVTVTDSTGKRSQQAVDVFVRRACATAPTPDEGYSLLFDGSTLTGWKQSGPGGFSVEDCAMTSYGGLGMLWYSEKQFKDYSLKLQFKLSDEGDNSGAFQRFPDPGDDPFVAVDKGHEIQIKEGQPGDEPQKTGSVYNFDREDARNAKPIGEWNDYVITVVGQTYTMTLNGVVVNEYTSDGSRGAEGFIGLQNHGTNDAVSIRAVQVKELEVDAPFVNTKSADPTRGAAPLTVNFVAEAIDRQGDVITYEWDFGDGTPVESGAAQTTHVYTEGRTYRPTVTPVDADGTRGLTRELDEITVLVDPTAQSTATPRCGLAPLQVEFTGDANDPQGQAVTYAWDFGVGGTDSDTSTAQSPSYTYAAAGKYTAKLTVTDPDGNTGAQSFAIEALAGGECRAVADLSTFFNNDGISTHDNPSDGNFDGGGWAFAAELLPEPVRTNGGPVTIDGVDYEFPSPADGRLNTVEADGQTLPLPSGSHNQLMIMASAHNGDVNTTGTLTYTDGSTVEVPLRFTDWAVSPKFGEGVAVDMPHRHNSGGDTGPRVYIWTQALAIDPTKDVASLTLPTQAKLHVLAISAVDAEVPVPCDQPERSDEFDDSELLDNCHWNIRRPNEALYAMSGGSLNLTAAAGEYSEAANITTQAAPGGEWSTTSKVTFDPDQGGQQAGLVVAGAGASGFAKLTFVNKGNGKEWIEFLKSSTPNNNFDFSGNWNTGGGSFDGPFLPADFPTTFWLRMTSDGTNLKGYYSTDGELYTPVGDPRALAGIDSPRIGVMAIKGGASGAPVAAYDFFRFGSTPPENAAPVVDLGADPTSGKAPLDVAFTSKATDPDGDTLSYAWDFGDGSAGTPTGPDPSHTYTSVGTHTATVVVTDARGAVTTDSVAITVEDGPVVGRTWVVDAVDNAQGSTWVSADTQTSEVTIDAGDTVEWQFDRATMGHDLTSTSPNWVPPLNAYREPNGVPVRYTFTEPGTYEYWCSIHGVTMKGTVIVRGAPANRPPTADPLVDPRTGPAPLGVHFEANATDPDGDELTYLWDFGMSGTPSDTSTSAHAHADYTEAGDYTATLTVSDGRGGTLTKEYAIKVTGGAPVATASAIPTSGRAPLDVVFGAQAEDAQGGLLTYQWDFGVPGDTDVATGMRPSYTYLEKGSYTATLTVTDEDGNEGTDTVQIEVDTMPQITAAATPATGDAPLDVAFSTGVRTEGEFAPLADGTSTFPGVTGTAAMLRARGTTRTTIQLTGLKPGGSHLVHAHEQSCADGNGGAHFRFDETQPFAEANEIWLPFTADATGTSGEVTVERPLRAGAKAMAIVIHDPDNPAQRIACADLSPSLVGLSYAWDFGDGTTGQGADPDHTYVRAGTYTAAVTLSDGQGREVSDSVEVTVAQGPGTPDTTAPQTTITSGPADSVRTRKATFRIASTEPKGATYWCSLDGAAYKACRTVTTVHGVGNGQHVMRAVSVDAAGNRDLTPATWTWRVDRRGR